ncbi:MAG: hypothetical protein ACRDPC_00875 [Solirubrobacteraceae bacterium]
MRLERIAGNCPDGRTCPTVYATDRDTLVVQGYAVPAHELTEIALPDGEAAVEIPIALLETAARAQRR